MISRCQDSWGGINIMLLCLSITLHSMPILIHPATLHTWCPVFLTTSPVWLLTFLSVRAKPPSNPHLLKISEKCVLLHDCLLLRLNNTSSRQMTPKYGAMVELYWRQTTEILREKPAPVTYCPPEIWSCWPECQGCIRFVNLSTLLYFIHGAGLLQS